MAFKILLACEANEQERQYSRSNFKRLCHYADLSDSQKYVKVSTPEEADLILFVGSSSLNYTDIFKSELYRQYKKKCVLFDSGDHVIPLIPGIYCCLENNILNRNRKTLQSGYYLRVTDNTDLDHDFPIEQASLLFSFAGNTNNHPARKQLVMLSHNRGFLRDTADNKIQQTDAVTAIQSQGDFSYLELLQQSKFVLCPRGIGVSSWRLFETMRAGRVPVIIADDWIPPPGPAWDKCSIRIPESKIGSIPEILNTKEVNASKLARSARQQWEQYYSPPKLFATVAKQAQECFEASQKEPIWHSWFTYLHYLKPFFFRRWLLGGIKKKLLS